jgi:hypothetical protein
VGYEFFVSFLKMESVMIIALDNGDFLTCSEDPSTPWISYEFSPPGFGQIAIFMCGDGRRRVGYGRGIELDSVIFRLPEDDLSLGKPTLLCWKKAPEPSINMC